MILKSHLRYPLDRLFSKTSHIAILRALKDSREGMSGRAVARQAGLNHQACAMALRDLESLGLIQRQGGGRTQLVRVNFDHELWKDLLLPLLAKERTWLSLIQQDILKTFKRDAVSLTLFGSAARGQDGPESDMDVLIVTPDSKSEHLQEKAAERVVEFRKKFGIRLAPIFLSIPAVRKMAKESAPFLKNILTDGIDFMPRRLRDVIQ